MEKGWEGSRKMSKEEDEKRSTEEKNYFLITL